VNTFNYLIGRELCSVEKNRLILRAKNDRLIVVELTLKDRCLDMDLDEMNILRLSFNRLIVQNSTSNDSLTGPTSVVEEIRQVRDSELPPCTYRKIGMKCIRTNALLAIIGVWRQPLRTAIKRNHV